jgi:hypothetical protein
MDRLRRGGTVGDPFRQDTMRHTHALTPKRIHGLSRVEAGLASETGTLDTPWATSEGRLDILDHELHTGRPPMRATVVDGELTMAIPVTCYSLDHAGEALEDLRAGRVTGAAIIVP